MDLNHFLQNHVKSSPQHNCFYHFTDRSNIDSIKKWHLLSMSNAKAQGVTVPKPGGNDLSLSEDKRTGMDKFVHLSFTMDHPMAFRAVERGQITDLVWLKVNPAIITRPGVLLTDVVSNSAGMSPLQPTDIDKLDLEVIYTRTNWKDSAVMDRLKIARKYEILVPHFIDLNDIRFP